MGALHSSRLWSMLTGMELVMGLLWLGLAAFTVALVVLIWTRWGQYQPLRKCLVLSLLAHFLLAGYATTVKIVGLVPPADGPTLQIAYIEGPGGPGAEGDAPAVPVTPSAPASVSAPASTTGSASASAARDTAAEKKEAPPVLDIPSPPAAPPPAATAVLDRPIEPATPAPVAAQPPAAVAEEPSPAASQAIDRVPAAAPAPSSSVPEGAANQPWAVAAASEKELHAADTAATASPPDAAPPVTPPARAIPEVYKLRLAPDHAKLAQGHGGSPETEAAVQADLRWLAENQSPAGLWNARQHEAGRATMVDGQDRQHTGVDADSAMTGLALLSFLASGHTHRDGPHRDEVRRGLEYLLTIQGTDGNLAGRADLFAKMYSHAIAAFALSEAYGMTGDPRLRDAVQRAVAYSAAAQDSYGGGWRYRPGDAGDTSQLGWQLMALKSADLAGIPLAATTRQGINHFLQSVASGRYGGLACYRPGEQATRTMTAEALVCWLFLGLSREHPACSEAGNFLLGQLPGQGEANVYYWYYGTLAMFQLQGDYWQRWNVALRAQLLPTQRKTGPLAGTWDPDAAWGGYGGRIYSTALSTLCLEVYYRYLPLYVAAGPTRQ